MIPGWIFHLAMDWEEPTWLRWCKMGDSIDLKLFD